MDIRSLEVKVEQFEDPITCLALRRDDPHVSGSPSYRTPRLITFKLACVAARGFALLKDGSMLEYISEPLSAEEQPHTRFNDGGCDSKGRFFAGTLYSPTHDVPGRLYRYDPSDKTCVIADAGPFTVRPHALSLSHR